MSDIPNILHNINRALETYRDRTYPQTDEALVGGGLKMDMIADQSKIDLVLDDGCCLIDIVVSKRKLYKVVIDLKDVMFSKSKASCPRSGKHYLAVVNELNVNVFSKHDTYMLDRVDVTFKVSGDSAILPGLPRMHVAGPTVRRTQWIANGGSFRTINITEDQIATQTRYSSTKEHMTSSYVDEAETVRDRSEPSPRRPSVRLKDVVDMDALRASQELFFERVLRHTHPDIYEGSIGISDLAKYLLRQQGFKVSLGRYIKKMIARIWYTYIVTNENSCSVTDPIPSTDDDNDLNITEVHLVLSILTLLKRDDCKTWYMAELGLEICSNKAEGIDLCEQVREFQQKRVGDLELGADADVDFRAHIDAHTNVKEAICDIVDHSRRTAERLFTFYDAYVYLIIETAYYMSFDIASEAFTENVCRKLIQSER